MQSRSLIVAALLALALVAGLVVLWTSGDPAPSVPRPADDAEAPSRDRTPPSPPTRPVTPIEPLPRPPDEDPEPAGSTFTVSRPVVVAGQVVDERGQGKKALVAAFRPGGDKPAAYPSYQGETADDGSFELPIFDRSSAEAVVVAYSPNRRPASARVALRPQPAGPVRLVLEEGVPIEGTVTLDSAPAIDASVSADLRFGTAGSFIGRTELWWTGQGFEIKRLEMTTGKDGRFRFAGLARDTYRVEAQNIHAGGMFVARSSCQREVTAPASGVAIDVQTGLVQVNVFGRGERLRSVNFTVSEGKSSEARRSVTGARTERLDLRVPVDTAYTVRAAATGFSPKTVTIDPVGQGEVRIVDITLDPIEGPSLHLTVRGAAAMKLDRIGVQIFARRIGPIAEERSGAFSARHRADEEFVVDSVPLEAGRYALVAFQDAPDGWMLPVQTEIDLPQTGACHVTIDATPGGRLELVVSNAAGAPIGASYSLRDSSGVEVMSGVAGARDVRLDFPGRSRAPEALLFRRSQGILAPGTYEVEVKSQGYRSVRRNIVVTAGSTTTEQVSLEHEKE